LPRTLAFWLTAGVFCLLFVATAAPSPLYRVYQGEWHFSTATLTGVFAVYALVLLVTLLVFGSVSDEFGRRDTTVAGLAAFAAACGVFLIADGVGPLLVARALQGVAVGLATGALGATLLELQPEGSWLAPLVSIAAPALGLAMGGFGTSALVQYGPALVYSAMVAALAATAASSFLVRRARTTRGPTPAAPPTLVQGDCS
jgi:MFS family permease